MKARPTKPGPLTYGDYLEPKRAASDRAAPRRAGPFGVIELAFDVTELASLARGTRRRKAEG